MSMFNSTLVTPWLHQMATTNVRLHYEKLCPQKPHCFVTKDSYKTTMQLNYNCLLEI